MKRGFQFAAVAVVLLLAVQPAMAGVACATSGMARAACPMGMSEMGADCPMAHGLVTDCSQDCCNHSAPKAMVLPAAPAKPMATAAWGPAGYAGRVRTTWEPVAPASQAGR